MALVIMVFKIMPDSPDVDLTAVEEKAKAVIEQQGGNFGKSEIEPIAFGLKALNLTLSVDEDKGSPDDLENGLKALEGVQSCEVTSVSRALG